MIYLIKITFPFLIGLLFGCSSNIRHYAYEKINYQVEWGIVTLELTGKHYMLKQRHSEIKAPYSLRVRVGIKENEVCKVKIKELVITNEDNITVLKKVDIIEGIDTNLSYILKIPSATFYFKNILNEYQNYKIKISIEFGNECVNTNNQLDMIFNLKKNTFDEKVTFFDALMGI